MRYYFLIQRALVHTERFGEYFRRGRRVFKQSAPYVYRVRLRVGNERYAVAIDYFAANRRYGQFSRPLIYRLGLQSLTPHYLHVKHPADYE